MPRLYRKWKVFADNYLRLNMNATRAYKATYGEQMDDKVAQAASSRLLSNVIIQNYISERMKAEAMGPEEVVRRLGQMARVDIADFVDEFGTVDIDKAKRKGISHLIKKVKQRTVISSKDGEDTETHTTDFELHDAQGALSMLGRFHKLFTDVSENKTTVNVVGLEGLLDKVYGTGDTDPG